MTDFSYPIFVTALSDEDGGGFLAAVPDLAGCMGDGDTRSAAIEDAESAILEWIDEAKRLNRKVPVPGSRAKRTAKHVEQLHELIDKQSEVLEMQNQAVDSARAEIAELRNQLRAIECDNSLTGWAKETAVLAAAKARRRGGDMVPH